MNINYQYLTLAIAALTLLVPCPSTAQQPQQTVVWEEKADGHLAHFVYGLTATRKGTILAFAEARISSGADDSAHHIVMKTSKDKGLTFSASKIVVESKNGESYANPTIVEDRSTNTLFLFYARNYTNDSTSVFFTKSIDDGQTWSASTEITLMFSKNAHHWTFHLPGPGHGIQLKNKRLVVPIWHRRSIRFAATERNYGVNCLYSDDHGKTWHLGGDTPVGQLNESQIVEQKNGDLLLIGRTIKAQKGSNQAKVWSKDGGRTWSQELVYDEGLTGPACDIGLIDYKNRSDILLVSQPAGPKKRIELTIRLSLDGGKTWKINKLLVSGYATYSDIAILPDNTILCLYGNGGTGHMPNTVSIARFTYDWLIQGEQ
jgi:sialidase-1